MKIYCTRRSEMSDKEFLDSLAGTNYWIRADYRHMPRYIKILSKTYSEPLGEDVYEIKEIGPALWTQNYGLGIVRKALNETKRILLSDMTYIERDILTSSDINDMLQEIYNYDFSEMLE